LAAAINLGVVSVSAINWFLLLSAGGAGRCALPACFFFYPARPFFRMDGCSGVLNLPVQF
jgi:hypothetical protein